MNVEYPIFAFEKDDHSLRLIENEERILYHLEAIDIENDEYVFWDAKGNGVRVIVSVGAFTSEQESVSACTARLSLEEAFRLFAESLKLPLPVGDGPPIEVWHRLQECIRKLQKGTVRRGTD